MSTVISAISLTITVSCSQPLAGNQTGDADEAEVVAVAEVEANRDKALKILVDKIKEDKRVGMHR